MIRPTGRTVLAFVCGIPLALIVAIYDPGLWVVSFAYGAMVLLAALTDASLAFPPRLLDLKIAVPDHVSIGDRGAVMAPIAATRWRRATTFELIADQRGEIEPARIVAGSLPPGEPLRLALPVIPRRRGQVHVDRVSVRWRGPLGLVEFVRVMTVDQIAARLDDRFHLLTGGARTGLPRHQTLRATLDWSYSLLGAAERSLLHRLAVFSGGWTLEAAEAICPDQPGAAPPAGS